jgi:hypothetical protein
MNIFFLSYSARRAAKYHCDKHVVKMILETCQMLYTAHWIITKGVSLNDCPFRPYKPAFKNHPCNVWLRESLSNYRWLCRLGKYLCKEFTHRYKKIHKCDPYIKWLRKNEPPIPDIGLTLPAKAMPTEYKSDCPVMSYRTYYVNDKSKFAEWKFNPVPYWYYPV